MTNTTNSKTLKLKLSGAVTLQRWLNQLPLAGKQSRQRTTFTAILSSAAQEVEGERTRLLNLYAEKSDDGTPKTFVDENEVEKFDISKENEDKFNKDLQAFLEKEGSYVFTDIELFNEIGTLIENTDFKFSGNLAVEYSGWCASFENAS